MGKSTLKYQIAAVLWLLCCTANAQTGETIGAVPLVPDTIAKVDSVTMSAIQENGSMSTMAASASATAASRFNLPGYMLTPEAAALAKMMNYPVSHNTGIPNISIPLHELKVGELTLPIELSYHAGGFKINEQAGRYGLGWSLSCDLQIIRTINGLDDFDGIGGYINNNKITTTSYPFSGNDGKKNAHYMAVDNQADGAPDKFYYKLLNKSGSFYFLKNGASLRIVPIPYDNVKIEYNAADFLFTITDTDGTVYRFGMPGIVHVNNRQSKGVEFSGSAESDARVTTWKCTKITAPNRQDEMIFTYGQVSAKLYSTYRDRIEYWNMFDNRMTGLHYADGSPCSMINEYDNLLRQVPFHKLSSPRYMIYNGGGLQEFHQPYVNASGVVIDKQYSVASPTQLNYNTSYIAGVYLSSIIYRGGTVQFTGGERISNLGITDHGETRIFRFYQSFAYNSNTNYLDSLRSGAEVHSFLYERKQGFGSYMKGQDAWGYANAKTVDVSYSSFLMPRISRRIQSRYTNHQYQITFPLEFGGSTPLAEEPDGNLMQRGMLKRIIYPGGGFVNFEYEANRYTEHKYQDGGYYGDFLLERMSGGLRIRCIAYYDHRETNVPAKRLYYVYGDLEEGTGTVLSPPKIKKVGDAMSYEPYSFSQVHRYVKTSPTKVDSEVFGSDSLTTYLPASSLDFTYATGAPVYYTKVTEYQTDKGLRTGKTVYKYYPGHTFMPSTATWVPAWNASLVGLTNIPFQKASWFLGALESVSEYRYKDGRFRLAHQKRYEYQMRQLNSHPLVAYSFPRLINKTVESSGKYTGGHACDFYEFITGYYNLPVGKLLTTLEEEKWFEDNDTKWLTTTYQYDHPDYLQPVSITVADANRNYTRYLKYSYDFPSNSVLNAMKERNIIAPVIEERVVNGMWHEISKILTDYKLNPVSDVDLPAYVKDKVQSSVNGGALVVDAEYMEYDKYGNVLRGRGRDLLVKSYLWGYTSRYPVAEVTGSDFNVSLLASIGSAITTNNIVSEFDLKNMLAPLYDMSNTMVNIYTYRPLLGISTHTNPQRLQTRYDYDAYGRLAVVRDHEDKVLQSTNYRYSKPSSFARSFFDASIPKMETFNRNASSGMEIVQAANPGEPSSEYSDYTDILDARTFSTASLAKIIFQSKGVDTRPVAFDFVQNGSIVVTHTHRLEYQAVKSEEFYLPPGDYTLVVRAGLIPYGSDVYIAPRMGNYPNEGGFICTGGRIWLNAGATYLISVNKH